MPITHQCTACRHTFHVPDEQRGKLLKCPSCKEPNRVRASGGAAAGKGERVRRAAPLRRAQSLDAPQPKVGKPVPTGTPVAQPTPVVAAAAPVVPPAVATPAETAQGAGFVAVSTDPQRGAAKGTQSHSPRRRTARKSSVPLWLWIAIGVLGLGAVSGGAAMVFSGPEIASSEPDEKPAVGKKDDRGKKETTPPASENIGDTLQRCIASTVIININTAKGGGSGTGFIIDKEKRWIATNHHVIEHALSGSIEFEHAAGVKFPIAGIVVADRRYDLAILELGDLPVSRNALDIDPSEAPDIPDKVYAIGAPSRFFSTEEGTVTRVLETVEMENQLKQFVRNHLRDDGSIHWVQHSATISKGNSGGPLVNDRGEVVGINTLVVSLSGIANMSLAVDVRHLRELVESAPDSATPFREWQASHGPANRKTVEPQPKVEPRPNPQPNPTPKPAPNGLGISPQKIRQLAEVNAARNWSPETVEQYAELQNLARMITTVQSSPEIAKLPAAARAALVQESQKALTQLSKFAVQASGGQIKAVNRFAPARINSPGVGAFFYATVPQQHLNKNADDPIVILRVIGVEQLVVIPVTKQFDKVKVGSRWLVLGVRGPRNYRLTIARGQHTIDSYGIQTKQLLLVKM